MLRTATIRTRVALVATLLAVSALLALGYQQVIATSATFSRAAEDQSLTLAGQVSSATAGSGPEVVSAVPLSDQGLDGLIVFDSQGRPKAASGRLAPALRDLGPQARQVARTGRALQVYRAPGGGGPTKELRPWTDRSTIQITIVPQEGGAMAAGFHVDWVTGQLRSSTLSTSLALSGGALFICFGLMLMLGRLVTRPLGRLASEVRSLDRGADAAPFSEQSSPELQRLASDVWQMHEDLTRAIDESATDPLTGIANHRAFHGELEAAVAEAQRTSEPLALIALDLDGLKLVNDGCGHAAGDRLIAAVAREMTLACGERDLCARVGGDEFAILCAGSDRDRAEELGRRVETAVASLSIEELTGIAPPRGVAPGVSVGVAELGADAASAEQLAHAADMVLYGRKFGGARRQGRRAPRDLALEPVDGGVVSALLVALEAKDACTRRHCDAVAGIAVELGRALRMEEETLNGLWRAAVLHDVGKIGVPDEILLKREELDPEEVRIMRRHPGLGHRLARGAGLPENEALWVLHHHEYVDGSGYPHGLRGDAIPLPSRIILVADAFEAMTSDRPYRAARPSGEAIAELRRYSGRWFDPAVVDLLASLVGARNGGPLRAGRAEAPR